MTQREIKIYNTLSGKKEIFFPLDGKTVKMYVCGITPYDSAHLGHARCYVTFDVIKRYLLRNGYTVKHIQNFTDVDDKIIKRSAEDGSRPEVLAQKYIDEYFSVMRQLNIMDAESYPLVTDSIQEIISLVEKLIEQKYAYISGGDVYFAVRKFQDYGKLSKRSTDELLVGARVEPSDKKSDPLDFALWKTSKEGEPSWDSPWGKGRPGWHIECSAMARKFLGETIDIHGGGQDLVFPHHENEIAQSEAATGKPFARFFVHNGFVTINSEKMSKSLGNFFTLKDIFKKYQPMVVRYFLISQHYRSPLDFSDDGLEQSKSAYTRILNALSQAEEINQNLKNSGQKTDEGDKIFHSLMEKFDSTMSDDFNTAGALSCLHGAADIIFKSDNPHEKLAARASIIEMANTLGIVMSTTTDIPDEVDRLIRERESARKSKNYKLADDIREKIKSLGYTVEDTKNGTKIKKL